MPQLSCLPFAFLVILHVETKEALQLIQGTESQDVARFFVLIVLPVSQRGGA